MATKLNHLYSLSVVTYPLVTNLNSNVWACINAKHFLELLLNYPLILEIITQKRLIREYSVKIGAQYMIFTDNKVHFTHGDWASLYTSKLTNVFTSSLPSDKF